MAVFSFDNFTTLSVTIEQHIATITLCRPTKRNCMNPAFWHELPNVLQQIDDQVLARVILLTAEGETFSAGMDLAVFSEIDKSFQGEPARRAEKMRREVLKLQQSFNALESIRIPVLACIQGGAIGAAVDMICACDIRYCTNDAYFSIRETQIGMTADVGTLQRLPHLMPAGLVRELAYTGRNFSAEEARSCGFVNQVFADQAEMLGQVTNIARQIAMNSPMAVSGCKHMLTYSRDHSVPDSLDYMATWQAGMFQMPDVQEALSALQDKRAPRFAQLHRKSSLLGSIKEQE